MTRRPHRVDPRQPGRARPGNRDQWLAGYKAGLGMTPGMSAGGKPPRRGCLRWLIGLTLLALLPLLLLAALTPGADSPAVTP